MIQVADMFITVKRGDANLHSTIAVSVHVCVWGGGELNVIVESVGYLSAVVRGG